ncbi:choice-of-anchor Q domain-containing protein [Paraconexibacter sp.]|uniref:choice-of-anchor Q domain-containing protein n=1 Tax=Paraconexibacter sp. TaxID=2949640 RepID=UPI0035682381
MRRSWLIGAAMWAVLAVGHTAQAAEYDITATADGPGSCVAGSATCTLRQAIIDAKGTVGRDTIRVPPGTYDLTGQDLILAIGEQVDIVGTDPRTTVLREVSGGDGRVFLVEQDASLHLNGVTVTGTTAASAILLFGGGNDLLLRDSVIAGNSAARGAAIDATSGAAVVVEASTLHGNTATERGGAIRVAGGSTIDVRRSTIAANAAPLGAGVSVQSGSVSFVQSTVAGGLGGGADLDTAAGATVQARATVLGGCTGAGVTSLGANLDAGTGCGLAAPGDRSGADPQLAALGEAGGPTPTRLPLAGSPLLDADPGCPAGGLDQRGVARPQGGACDIGAVEVVVAPPAVAPSQEQPQQVLNPSSPPRIRSLALRPTRFRVGTRRGRGTSVRVVVADAAVLRLRVQRRVAGRRVAGRCRAPGGRRVRSTRRCSRWVWVKGAVERPLPKGTSRVRFSGRLAGRSLRPGSYRLVARIRAAGGGSHGRALHRSFRVVRASTAAGRR